MLYVNLGRGLKSCFKAIKWCDDVMHWDVPMTINLERLGWWGTPPELGLGLLHSSLKG